MKKNSRSELEWERVARLKELTDKWARGVEAVNSGKIHADVAFIRFAKLTDEIAACIDGYENVREIQFLMDQWFDSDWETNK